MNTYQPMDSKTLIGKTVIFRGCGQVVEIDRFERGEFHGVDLLTNRQRTTIDAEFIQDGIIVMEREEARQVFAVPLAVIEKYFDPEEEEEAATAEKEAVGV